MLTPLLHASAFIECTGDGGGGGEGGGGQLRSRVYRSRGTSRWRFRRNASCNAIRAKLQLLPRLSALRHLERVSARNFTRNARARTRIRRLATIESAVCNLSNHVVIRTRPGVIFL